MEDKEETLEVVATPTEKKKRRHKTTLKPTKLKARNETEKLPIQHLNSANRKLNENDVVYFFKEMISYCLKEMKVNGKMPASWTGANIIEMAKSVQASIDTSGGEPIIDAWLDEINSNIARNVNKGKMTITDTLELKADTKSQEQKEEELKTLTEHILEVEKELKK